MNSGVFSPNSVSLYNSFNKSDKGLILVSILSGSRDPALQIRVSCLSGELNEQNIYYPLNPQGLSWFIPQLPTGTLSWENTGDFLSSSLYPSLVFSP